MSSTGGNGALGAAWRHGARAEEGAPPLVDGLIAAFAVGVVAGEQGEHRHPVVRFLFIDFLFDTSKFLVVFVLYLETTTLLR